MGFLIDRTNSTQLKWKRPKESEAFAVDLFDARTYSNVAIIQYGKASGFSGSHNKTTETRVTSKQTASFNVLKKLHI